MFRGNTISIRFSYFGNPNWTKKPSGIFFLCHLIFVCLFLAEVENGRPGEFVFFECVSYIYFFLHIFFSVRHSARAHFDCWADKDRDGIRRILLAERVSGEGRTSDRVREREKRKKNHADEKQQILTRHHSPLNSSSRIIIMKKKKENSKEKKKITAHTNVN